MDVEDMLYNEKKDEEDRDKIRRKIIPIVDKSQYKRKQEE